MPAVRLCCMLLLALLIAGCAIAPGKKQPIKPDLSMLAPAEQAMQKAVAAHVEQFAPRALDAARGRISLARDILYVAARQGREPNKQETERVKGLVKAAQLDARLARVKTQALAVGVKLKQMQQTLGYPGARNNEVTQ